MSMLSLPTKKLSLSNILAGANKTIAECDAFVKQSDAAIQKNEVEVAKLQAANAHITTERGTAERVGTKFRELIS